MVSAGCAFDSRSSGIDSAFRLFGIGKIITASRRWATCIEDNGNCKVEILSKGTELGIAGNPVGTLGSGALSSGICAPISVELLLILILCLP